MSAFIVLSVLTFTGLGCSQLGNVELKDPSKTPGEPIPTEKRLTQDDVLYADLPEGPFLWPDGTRAMWIVGNYVASQEAPVWHLFVADLATLSKQEIAVGTGVFQGTPKWSPDGTAIALCCRSL